VLQTQADMDALFTRLNSSVTQLIAPLQTAVAGLQQKGRRKKRETGARDEEREGKKKKREGASGVDGQPQLPPPQPVPQLGHMQVPQYYTPPQPTLPMQYMMMPPPPPPLPQPPPQPPTGANAELHRLLAQEEARAAAERVRATAAQARIAELQAMQTYRTQ